jgi:hypothetical protein
MGQENNNSGEQERQPELPCIAMVVSHGDSTYMGRLKVELLRNAGNDNEKSPGQIIEVDYMSPFYGTTNIDYVDPDPDDYNNTQKSFGMWMIPPTPGSYVMVIFHNGKIERGYWIGCLPGLDAGSNFSVPGIAATKYNLDDAAKRIPVAEYNKIAQGTQKEETKADKPRHLFADVLETQGLLADDIRGITTSSARRETPSMVFGISTPGPVDKNGKQGEIGEAPKKIPNARVSFLGGTTFVMDDGDDKYLRKTPASDGPPEYTADEQGEDGGDNTIPHNELVRIRTRTGHQILFHNSEDLIYIGNAKGTTWIELTSNGKIDIFAEDSISIRTKQDFNFYADRDINFEAKRNVNIKAGLQMQLETGTLYNVVVGTNGKLTVGGTMDLNTTGNNNFTSAAATNIRSAGNHIETAAQIHMNGPAAATATKAVRLKTHNLPDVATPGADMTEMTSIMRRAPTAEPYPQHENLDPTKVTATKTDRDSEGRTGTGATTTMSFAGTKYKEYTTVTDTFEQIKPPEEEPEEDQ